MPKTEKNNKSQSSRKSSRKSSKKSSRKSLSKNYLGILDNLEKLNTTYTDLLNNVEATDTELDTVLKKIEALHSKVKYDYYPSIHNLNMSKKIFELDDFNKFKIPNNEEKLANLKKEYEKEYEKYKKNPRYLNEINPIKKEKGYQFELSNTQILLKNFMSNMTPYRGLLIFHGTGVGKTCTGITIAESLKKIVTKNKKKIYLIRYEEFYNQLFEINKVKTNQVNNQCTRNTYLKELVKGNKSDKVLIDKCKENPVYCDQLFNKIKKIIKTYYDMRNVEKWAKDTEKLINKKKYGNDSQEQHLNKINTIRKEFNNSIIIIDEAHHINSPNNELKLITNVLNDILKYSYNVRLILMTATPIWDNPTDIISLVNFLLLNDKRPTLKNSDIFKNNGDFKTGGMELFKNKINGYVSYLKSENILSFPTRISAKFIIPDKIMTTYPKKLIKSNELDDKTFKFKIFDVIDAPMKKEQAKVYNYKQEQINKKEDSSSIWAAETQISNFIYNTLSESKNDVSLCIGEEGFKNVTTKVNNNTYKFKKEDYGKRFLRDNIAIYSSKIKLILDHISKSNGPVFIFSKYLWGGLIPVLIALEMNGYHQYKSSDKPFIMNRNKSSKNNGSYVIKSGSIKTPNLQQYINKRHSMIDENVKVFLGTETAAEGLNLFGYREVHILEPHFNFSLIEQVIGRTIRNESHISLPHMKRNVGIYLYASTNKNDETIDLYKYRISEHKARQIGVIEGIMKELAFDCYLNYYYNNDILKNLNVKILNPHNKIISINLNNNIYSRICNYSDKCGYKCQGQKSANILLYSTSSSKESNISVNNLINGILILKNKITKLVLNYYLISLDDLMIELNVNKNNKKIFEIAIIKIIDENKVYTLKNGIQCTIGYFNGYLRLNIQNKHPNLELSELNKIINHRNERINEIDLKFYINKLQELNIKDNEKTPSGYESVVNIIKYKINKLKQGVGKPTIFNIEPSNFEMVYFFFNKLEFSKKNIIIEGVISYIKEEDKIGSGSNDNQNNTTNKYDEYDKELRKIIVRENIIYYKDINFHKKTTVKQNKTSKTQKISLKSKRESRKNDVYGYINSDHEDIKIYKYNLKKNKFTIDNAYYNNIIQKKIKKFKKVKINKLYGYYINDYSDTPPKFKIMDLTLTDKKSQKGSKCIDKQKHVINKYYKMFNASANNKVTQKKNMLCNDLQILFLRKDSSDTKNRWFLNSIEYYLLKKM
jgi:hypothetical protein